jgi:hypothetical protein
MFKLYLASALAAFSLYGTAQYKGWSMFASEAQEFQRIKSEGQSSGYGRGGSGGGSGGSSGHK